MKLHIETAHTTLARISVLLFSLFPTFMILSCTHTPTQPTDTTFSLTVEDVSCTEVYLQLNLGTGIPSREVTLKRDTVLLFTRTINGILTTLTDTGLRPNHTYNYTASVGGNSQQCLAKTMDTTSHNFIWDAPVLLGDVSSGLNDVALINDTLAYAVGAISHNDSAYNLARWNGLTWQIQKIEFYTFCGQENTAPYPASSIYAFGDADNWISLSGDQVTRSDGHIQSTPMCMPVSFSISKLWGENATSVFAVGNMGTIVHYDGSTWTRIEGGTTLPFQDISGSEGQIIAVASDKFGLGGKYLIQVAGNMVSRLSASIPTAVSLSSVWFVANHKYFLVGNGIYTKRLLSDSLWQYDPIADQLQTYEYSVRGTRPNDVFVVGEHGAIAHYNGVDWRIYSYAGQTSGDRLLSVSIKNNVVVAVGQRYVDGYHDQALICIGRRL